MFLRETACTNKTDVTVAPALSGLKTASDRQTEACLSATRMPRAEEGLKVIASYQVP